MKYIKKYENLNVWMLYSNKIYWLVSTDDRFTKSLEKIGCSIFNGAVKDRINREHLNFIYVAYDPTSSKISDIWGWGYYPKDRNFFENHGYNFYGNIDIEDYELDANKFNI